MEGVFTKVTEDAGMDASRETNSQLDSMRRRELEQWACGANREWMRSQTPSDTVCLLVREAESIVSRDKEGQVLDMDIRVAAVTRLLAAVCEEGIVDRCCKGRTCARVADRERQGVVNGRL